MKKFFKNLMPMLLLVAGLGISPNLWGVNTYFTQYEAIFFYAGTNSAYRDGATVKIWYNKNGSGGSAVKTKQVTGNYNYAIVPSTELNQLQVQRESSSGTWYNSDGDLKQSNRSKDSYNVVYLNNYGVSWKNETYGFVLRGTDKWTGDGYGKFVDQHSGTNGHFAVTFDIEATTTEYEFKVADVNGTYFGSSNTKLTGLIVGATYSVTADFYLDNLSYLSLTKTQKTFSVTASSANTNMGTVSPASAWVGSSAVTFTATPETGYHWTSWSNTGGASPSNAATSSVTATADGTITANFAANTHKLSWVTDGDALTGDYTYGDAIAYGTSITAPDTPTKTGYTFAGWSNGSSVVTPAATMPDNDLTYTATWTAHETTVTLDDQGATTAGSGTVTATYGSAMPSASKPAKTGYTFVGYFSETGGAGTKYYDSTPKSLRSWDQDVETATLYAHWTPKTTTITLDNQGADAGKEGTQQITGTYDQPLPTIVPPQKTGFNFVGYYNNSTTKYINADGTSAKNWNSASATFTLIAHWESAATYSLSINKTTGISAVTGAVAGKTSVPFDQAITATLETGYNFAGWTASPTENADFTTTTHDGNVYSTIVTVKNGSVTVTANAEAKTTVLKLWKEDGTGTYTQATATYGQPIQVTIPTRTGYTFNGYYITSGPGTSGTQIIKGDGTFVKNQSGWVSEYNWIRTDASKDLYAHWTATKSNKLTLSKNFKTTATHTGSDGEAWITFDATAFTDYAAATSSTGFTLLGYALESNGTTMIADADGNFLKDVEGYTDVDGKWINPAFPSGTIYAIWEEALTTLTIAANEPTWGTLKYNNLVTGIEWGMTTLVGVDTQSKKIIATAKTGYIFTGWTIQEGDENKISIEQGDGYITVNGKGIANSEATIQANFVEDLSTGWNINLGYDGLDHWITTEFTKKSGESTGKVAYVTANLETGHDYKFKYRNGDNWYGQKNDGIMDPNSEWALDGNNDVKINVSISGEYTFKIDYTNSSKPKATYFKPSINALNSNFTGNWARTDGTVDNGVLTVNYEITQAMVESQSALEFEMIYDGTYYGPGIDKTEMTVNNHTDWELSPSTGHHVVLKPSVAGQYTFVFTEEGAKLDVTYPAPPTYTVTMAVEGPGTTTPATSVELNAFTGTEIKATATEHSGYHFKNWTGTEGITFTDANAATTTAKATGRGTITAHFEKDTYIYFNNTIAQKWTKEPIYIYLYKGEGYWSDDKGTGAESGGNYMNRYEMTKLPNTEIWSWHYDQLHSFQGDNKITYVAFSNSDMAGYQYFHNGQAVYKYYNDCMNMFVPDASQTPKQINNTDYYNDGFWRKYNDTSSKMYLHIWDVTAGEELDGDGYELTTKTAGNDAFNRTVKLGNNHQYNIYIGSCDGKNYSRKTTINSDNCSGIQLYKYETIESKGELAYLHTGAGGNYVFTLTYDKDKMTLSVEYPVTTNDYRVKIGDPARYSNIIRSTEPSGTISMFLNAGINTLTYEEATDVNVDPIVWGNTKSINVNVANAGVYTMTLTKGTTPTITDVIPYTGKYYVRTDCAQGGWNEYKTNDNNLMRYTERQPDYEDNPATGFNYYYCRWNENAEGNVRFVIANEINPCISDTLKEDAILDNTEFLKGKANIRFSWNSNTNALNRAYISGSYDDAEYLQIRSDGSKLFKKQDGSEPITDAKLDDNNDWTYIIDVYADGQARAAVSAKYNNKYQFFVGAGDTETGAVTGTIQVIKVASKAHMQLVYDFKTDRIVTGWIPGDVITADITLQSDAILTRVHQGQLSPIKFSSDGISVLEVQTMYGVLQLDKATMTDGHSQDADKIYERNIYWISFPFDVRVGDIFGVDGYGEKWVMQRYNGAKRAEIGWFAETSTFWEYMEEDDIMEANVGYTLTLDPDYFDNASDAMWANGKTSVSFYFPSVTHNIDVVSNGQAKSSIPAHECKINRTFDDGKKNHQETDSHWNVIGIPTFQDLVNPSFDVPSVYRWDPVTNTYSVQALIDFTLEASHAYFVQWGREDLVTWPNASIIKPKAPYKYADAKNYMVDLYFSYGDKEDHTYINLKDEAKQDFVLNEDMMKMTNSGQPNIYSYAGAYDVAYNATAFENQTVNLGVIARKNGTYTFAMPKDFSGKAVLVDLESGETTDLNMSDYTVELNKGTYNNRFQLVLEVEAKAPTAIDNVDGGLWRVDGKTKKLLINDRIYLINGGRVYNAMGVER